MCLIVFAYDMHPDYRLVLAANRDEFTSRPTASARWWQEPEILAGRDLSMGGSWLGLDRCGRMAAVTNVRNPRESHPGTRSRGEMVPAFLAQPRSGPAFATTLDADAYPGYNLLLYDASVLTWHSNRALPPRLLPPGLYALSNAALDTPWPKALRAKKLLAPLLSGRGLGPGALFTLLADTRQPDDADLPDTGIGLDWERLLAPIFIRGEVYGTRSSTVVLQRRNGAVSFFERTFSPGAGGFFEVTYNIAAGSVAGPYVAALPDN
jgi:uncharacterized protein with NRDE domain